MTKMLNYLKKESEERDFDDKAELMYIATITLNESNKSGYNMKF